MNGWGYAIAAYAAAGALYGGSLVTLLRRRRHLSRTAR
jgi:hypothetical protein